MTQPITAEVSQLRTVEPQTKRKDDRAPTAIVDGTIQEQLARLDDEWSACVGDMQRIMRHKIRLQCAHDALLGMGQGERKEDASEAQS